MSAQDGPRFVGEEKWRLVASTGSTNADLLDSAHRGDWSTTVLVSAHQEAGRGRLDRIWKETPGSSLLISFLVSRRDVSSLLPLALGLAALGVVRARGGAEAGLKWPNDLLVGERKLAGILVETVVDSGEILGAVAGMGMNLRAAPAGAISLAALLGNQTDKGSAAGEHSDALDVDRDSVARDLAANFGRWLEVLEDESDAGGSALLLEAYSTACVTIGREVRVELVGGSQLIGHATGVDGRGRLLVAAEGQVSAVEAGDVHHLRPASFT